MSTAAIKRELEKLRDELSKKKHHYQEALPDIDRARIIAFDLAVGVAEGATDEALERAWTVSAMLNPEEPTEWLTKTKDWALEREAARLAGRPSWAPIFNLDIPTPLPAPLEDEQPIFVGDLEQQASRQRFAIH